MPYSVIHPEIDAPPKLIPEHTLASYAASGWVLADPERDPFQAKSLPLPPRSASAPVWKTYAVVVGMDFDKAMASTATELADKYHPAATTRKTTTPVPAVAPAPSKES